jgi:hypothetical protein
MSLGTATVRDAADAYSQIFCAAITCAGDSAYPTGGTADFGAYMRTALASRKKGDIDVIAAYGYASGGLYVAFYDAVNDKLLVFDGTLAQPTAATDLSASTFALTVLYK